MIDSQRLLADLRRLLKTLDADLRDGIREQPALSASLQAEWQGARAAGRTGASQTEWLDEEITQSAVHWILGCVFVRFLEDNGFLERPWLSGPDAERLALARDRHEQYFRDHPHESDRDYLLACFREVARLPGMAGLFDERHNPVFRVGVSGDGAMALTGFWQKVDPDTGHLLHDFADPAPDTRFLGDLYQDLSEAARKRYALLQTPVFVEEFILDRTLTPAIDEFGYREVRLIDPTCGSGHFLLGAFRRLFDLWARNEPARNSGDLVQKALDGVHGVDLNPYAVAIARFRLLIAALAAGGVTRLKDAPAFRIHLAAGDSLLHGRRFNQLDLGGEAQAAQRHGYGHAYEIEDLEAVNAILGRQYHAVVGNPPYITVKDAALNAAYRARYGTCHMKYSLGVPFTERFFELALPPSPSGRGAGGEGGVAGAGFVGMITTNSFMKREFGAKLIEAFLPRVDLTHVIDTSGAYIPGHGTPTVILFGRDRRPVGDTVRTVMGIKGEPATPEDPARGLVWTAIVTQLDRAGSESAYVSVADTPRLTFAKHPWSIGGGGAADLLESLNDRAQGSLGKLTTAIGRTTHTGEDNVFYVPLDFCARFGLQEVAVPLVEGEGVRDHRVEAGVWTLFPYDKGTAEVRSELPLKLWRHFWLSRRLLKERRDFGNYIEDRGLRWYEHSMFFPDRYRVPLGIAFAFVATHNHFVLDRGGKVFKQTAPVIKLPADATEDEHLGLLGLLNSSVACFWLKQVSQNRGSTIDTKGARQRTAPFEDFYEIGSAIAAAFPVADPQPIDLARRLDTLGRELSDTLPAALLARGLPTRASLDAARERAAAIRRRMIALQEELDWRCYRLYGLTDESLETADPPGLTLGERAFEIVLARRMAEGEETTWFARHGSTPITEVPAHWPEDHRRLVERRIALIESDRNIGLIERPEYKRRWNAAPWDELEQAALRGWLLDRLEAPSYWQGAPQLKSAAKLADAARSDANFMQVAELYAGRGDFDVSALVARLVESESVPFLPVLRYTESGLRKRAEWEACWAKQRHEDAIDAEAAVGRGAVRAEPSADTVRPTADAEIAAEQKRRKAVEVGDIPVPPKYKSADFLKSDLWRVRGGLDVPKERFVSYPHCQRSADGTLPVAWAGWDHLQQATALAAYYLDMKDNEGWPPERLQPLLAGLLELVPWLKQWHNDYNPEHATRMGEYFESFVADEARGLGFTLDDLRGWKPAATAARRGRRRGT